MTYQVLARKWRPQDFSSLVGQEHVVTALGNALAEERIAQAYLFSGIRGVGKTTAARVLSKALNCERGPAANPCNECTSCVEITSGNSLDVIEVDAATYSKVEQVRELTETLRYGPANGRYKVVVLDEVHRLSRQAFDALLKIVEEPPAHLVFIFATTEIDAVPATILSRCQEFQFRRVTQPVLAAHLRHISDAEKIVASDAALRMIARAGEGSVRDSVALLDQMATFGSGTISDEDAQRILGGLDTAIFQKLLVAVLEGQRQEIVSTVREIEANGWDPHNVYSQFLVFLRDALHLALGGEESGELPAEEAAMLRQSISGHSYEALLQILQLLISSEPTVRRSEFSLLALEIAWLRAAELPKVTRLQELLTEHPSPQDSGSSGSSGPSRGGGGGPRPSGSGGGPVARQASTPPKMLERPYAEDHPEVGGDHLQEAPWVQASSPVDTDSAYPGPSSDHAAEPAPGPYAAAPVTNRQNGSSERPPRARARSRRPVEKRPAEENAKPQLESGQGGGTNPGDASLPTCDPARIPPFLELLANRRQSLAAHFEEALLRFDRRTLLISPPEGDFLFTKALERQSNIDTLKTVLLEVWGEGVTWRFQGFAPPKPKKAPERHERPRMRRPAPQAPPADEPSFVKSSPPPEESPAHQTSLQEEPAWMAPNPQTPPSIGEGSGGSVSTEEAAALSDLPVVRYILSTFGGKIQSVETAREESPQ